MSYYNAFDCIHELNRRHKGWDNSDTFGVRAYDHSVADAVLCFIENTPDYLSDLVPAVMWDDDDFSNEKALDLVEQLFLIDGCFIQIVRYVEKQTIEFLAQTRDEIEAEIDRNRGYDG